MLGNMNYWKKAGNSVLLGDKFLAGYVLLRATCDLGFSIFNSELSSSSELRDSKARGFPKSCTVCNSGRHSSFYSYSLFSLLPLKFPT
jgi:hypothetical protein